MKDGKKKTMTVLGQRLKILRIYHGMDQKDLANRLGYAQSFISGIEAGKKILPTDALINASHLFGVDLSFFDPQKPIILQPNEPILVATGNTAKNS